MVDGHGIAGEKLTVLLVEVGLGANARDPGVDVEQGVGHLAGDHVDFVVQGDGDQHVGIGGAGAFEDVGMGGVAVYGANVEDLVGAFAERFAGVDDRDVVAFGRQPFGDARFRPVRPRK